MEAILRVDAMGEQLGGDRIELFSPREEAQASANASRAGSRTSSRPPSLPPSLAPSLHPSLAPSLHPSAAPSLHPSLAPSLHPSLAPSLHPSAPGSPVRPSPEVRAHPWGSPVTAGWDGGYEYLGADLGGGEEHEPPPPPTASTGWDGGGASTGWDGGYECLQPTAAAEPSGTDESGGRSHERAGDPSFTRFGEMY